MKRVDAEYPYDAYYLYVVHHRKENRRMANLILKTDVQTRTTISYARYLLSVYLKRFLEKDEHVDHVDNDKMNDDISNLQILSPQENKVKQEIYNAKINPKYIELCCAGCGKIFNYPSRNYRFYTKQGRVKFSCSRECSYRALRKSC